MLSVSLFVLADWKSHVALRCRKGKVFAYKNGNIFSIMLDISHLSNYTIFLGKSLGTRFWKSFKKSSSWSSPFFSGPGSLSGRAFVLADTFKPPHPTPTPFLYCREMIKVQNLFSLSFPFNQCQILLRDRRIATKILIRFMPWVESSEVEFLHGEGEKSMKRALKKRKVRSRWAIYPNLSSPQSK